MKTKGSNSNEFCFNPGSWATLLLALGFIASAGLYLFLAFKQPTDGQVYETRLAAPFYICYLWRQSEKESRHLASNGARNDSRTLAGYNIDN